MKRVGAWRRIDAARRRGRLGLTDLNTATGDTATARHGWCDGEEWLWADHGADATRWSGGGRRSAARNTQGRLTGASQIPDIIRLENDTRLRRMTKCEEIGRAVATCV